jgi:5,5'-dehydrodivanillate O-demethylase
MGQGEIANRVHERLGKSDAGVVFLRNLFMRELNAIKSGQPTKQWSRLEKAMDMPIPARPQPATVE